LAATRPTEASALAIMALQVLKTDVSEQPLTRFVEANLG
jgi:hypothetical protein